MADDKRGPNPPGGKRRRPPTTIDLKATEVASESAQPTEPIDSPQETSRTEAPQAAAGTVGEPPREPQQPLPGRRPSRGGWRPEWLDAAVMNERISALREQLTERMNWRLIAAGATGAAAMLVVFLALWVFGATANRDDLTVMLAARLAILEQQVGAIANRPQPAGLDQRALADLAARVGAAEQAMGRLADLDARVGKIETAAAAPRPAQPDQALTARVAALEAAVRPLAELGQTIDAANVAARDAKSRADAAFEAAQKSAAAPADHKEIEALTGRVAALEQAANAAEEKIARATLSAGADRAGRLAFVTLALRSAAERGEPFAQELAAAKALAPDAPLLAPLEPFAATGVPRAATLARELAQLTGPMLSAASTSPREGGILDRLAQNAERLVRIRPINEAPGEDAAAIVARAEAKASHGDIAGALSELSQLPDVARAPAQAWIKRAEAQVTALGAARKLADNAVGALGKASP